MKLTWKDAVSTVFMAAIVVIYVWFANHQRVVQTFVTNLRGPEHPLTFGGARSGSHPDPDHNRECHRHVRGGLLRRNPVHHHPVRPRPHTRRPRPGRRPPPRTIGPRRPAQDWRAPGPADHIARPARKHGELTP